MSSASAVPGQSQVRGRGRGNRGKYLRARGRRGLGRAAEFTPRLLLEGEGGDLDTDDDEDDQNDQGKYAKREIVDNADKYADPGVQDTNAEEELVEPEIDLEAFLAKQQLKDTTDFKQLLSADAGEDDVDHSLSKSLISITFASSKPRKNNAQVVEWDSSMEELRNDKEAADAVRDLKTRLRNSQLRPTRSHLPHGAKRATWSIEDSRHKPNSISEENASSGPSKAELEDFLDDLLS